MNKKALRKAALGVSRKEIYTTIDLNWSRPSIERNKEIIEWFGETLGPPGKYKSGAQYPYGNPPHRWLFNESGYRILVLNESDVLAYKLKWE